MVYTSNNLNKNPVSFKLFIWMNLLCLFYYLTQKKNVYKSNATLKKLVFY